MGDRKKKANNTVIGLEKLKKLQPTLRKMNLQVKIGLKSHVLSSVRQKPTTEEMRSKVKEAQDITTEYHSSSESETSKGRPLRRSSSSSDEDCNISCPLYSPTVGKAMITGMIGTMLFYLL